MLVSLYNSGGVNADEVEEDAIGDVDLDLDGNGGSGGQRQHVPPVHQQHCG